MKKFETFSNLILVLVGVVFCISSLRLGIGTIRVSGPGLIPFGMGILLILLSFGTIIEAQFERKVENEANPFRGKRWGVVISVMVLLFAYAFLLKSLGFILVNFLTFTFLFKIPEKQSWKLAVGASALTTASAYFLFDYLLKVTLPVGFLGF